jgi:tRNA pseudouridine55 synthase
LSRRRKGSPVHGVVLLDKPPGLSSNQALQRVRRAFDARKAGHTGTLDPFATGMLPCCLGEATKTSAFLLDADKAYRATARLGVATSTGDLEGEAVEECQVPSLDRALIEAVLADFTGEIEQMPPMYSALKHEGRPLYEWARQGVVVERKRRRVTIRSLRLLDWASPDLSFEVTCSKGTYVRTLAEDLARELGTCAHLTALRRLWVEPFRNRDMVTLEALEQAAGAGEAGRFLLPLDVGLEYWPLLRLAAEDTVRFSNGNPVPAELSHGGGVTGDWVRVESRDGVPLGLGELDGGLVHPRRVYRLD